jgi:hypothetical protein
VSVTWIYQFGIQIVQVGVYVNLNRGDSTRILRRDIGVGGYVEEHNEWASSGILGYRRE